MTRARTCARIATGTGTGSASSAPRTVVLRCQDWPLTAAGIDPAVPAVVFRANRVVACTRAARDEGIELGLRRRDAQALFPEVELIEHDPARDARAFEPLVAGLEAVCPRVEVVRPGVAAFLARGPSRYFGGDLQVAARTLRTVRDLSTVPPLVAATAATVGIADGLFAAMLAARLAADLDGSLRATLDPGPPEPPHDPAWVRRGRWYVVPPGTDATRAFLAPFPVRNVEAPDPELPVLFARLGVFTLGDLAAMEPELVLGRFGVEGQAAARLARGEQERPLAPRDVPDDLSLATTLDPPVDTVDHAAFVAKSLADRLHAELARRGSTCSRIVIEAETEHGERLTRVWRHAGALTPGATAERVRWQLDGWLTSSSGRDRPSAGIALVRLTPEDVRPDDGRQLGFWGGATANDERAVRALARVQGMLGCDAVATPVLQGGRSPRQRVRLVPWGDAREPERPELEIDPGAGPGDPRLSPWPGGVPAPAPAVVHPQPLAAEVVDAAGRPVHVTGRDLCSAPPARISIQKERWQEVVAWSGPWLVDERWWDPRARRRQACFQLVVDGGGVEGGAAYLAVVEAGRWWLEAVYD
jgi:protein ImuB